MKNTPRPPKCLSTLFKIKMHGLGMVLDPNHFKLIFVFTQHNIQHPFPVSNEVLFVRWALMEYFDILRNALVHLWQRVGGTDQYHLMSVCWAKMRLQLAAG